MPTPRLIYVSEAGNDSNDGASASHALRTIRAAIDLAYTFIGDAQIRIADGEYPGTNATALGCRMGRLEIIGNLEHPERVRIDSGEELPAMSTIWAAEGAILSVAGLHVSSTSERPDLLASSLRATYNGIILITGDMVFGRSAYAHIVAGNGRIIPNHGYTIEAGARYHLLSSTSGSIATTTDPTQKVTIKNNPHFSGAFAAAQTLSVINWRLPFEGDATGVRHIISDAGCIALKSIGSNPDLTPDHFPGDADGRSICGFYNGEVHGTNLRAPS